MEPQADSRKITEAQEAREALGAALRRAGIQLPAMDVRVPASTSKAYAFVNLGKCSAPVAHDLAAVIEKGADR